MEIRPLNRGGKRAPQLVKPEQQVEELSSEDGDDDAGYGDAEDSAMQNYEHTEEHVVEVGTEADGLGETKFQIKMCTLQSSDPVCLASVLLHSSSIHIIQNIRLGNGRYGAVRRMLTCH